MFTGIIQSVGKVADSQPRGQDVRLSIAAGGLDLNDVQLGDSIAVNGVCLTVIAKHATNFEVDVSAETLRCTIGFDLNSAVNLEKALRLADRLGGHLVSGHVDGVGEVVSRQPDERAEKFVIRAPSELAKYIAQKGSICVDGTSLTVNGVNGCEFELTIVPHTLKETIMNSYQAGTLVNLEVDIIARYCERLLLGDKAALTDSAK